MSRLEETACRQSKIDEGANERCDCDSCFPVRRGAKRPTKTAANMSEAAKAVKAAADALGMPRTGGPGGALLPEIDVINRMEILGSGTSSVSGQTVKTEYHAALGYNPPAMRLEITRTNAGGTRSIRFRPSAIKTPGMSP